MAQGGQRLSEDERVAAVQQAMQRIGTAQAAPVAREVKRYYRERGVRVALDRETVTKDLAQIDREVRRWEDDQLVRGMWRERRAQMYADNNARIAKIHALIDAATAKTDAEPPDSLMALVGQLGDKERGPVAKELAQVYGAVASSRLMGKVAFAAGQAAEQERNLRELMEEGPVYERVQKLAEWLNEKAPELRAAELQAGRDKDVTFADGR